MPISRRRFLQALGFGAGALAAAYRAEDVRRSLGAPQPPPAEAPPGPLAAGTEALLLAAAEALAGTSPLRGPYAGYYRWRAEHLPGYRALYEQLAARLRPSFVACDLRERAALLDGMRPYRRPLRRTDKLRLAFSPAGLLLYRFEKYIFAETLALFAHTDAYLLLGYDFWPGQARPR